VRHAATGITLAGRRGNEYRSNAVTRLHSLFSDGERERL
jgi:hypothetical protein